MSQQIITLPRVIFRKDESKAIKHIIKEDGAPIDLTGWIIELYINGVKLKTITTNSDPNVAGIISDQGSNTGEYFFVIRTEDITQFATSKIRELQAYMRYITPETSPPRVFSNVEFIFELKNL